MRRRRAAMGTTKKKSRHAAVSEWVSSLKGLGFMCNFYPGLTPRATIVPPCGLAIELSDESKLSQR